MFKHIRRAFAIGAVLAAVGAPATASAFYSDNPLQGPSTPSTPSWQSMQNGTQATSSSTGFQWDDAGIGAGAVVLIGVGSGAVLARRRRIGPLAG